MGLVEYAARELTREIGKKSREFYELITPAIDMYEDVNDLVVEMDLPGFAREDINIRIIDGNILSVIAKKKKLEEPTGMTYQRQRPTHVNKRIILPHSIKDGETAVGSAKYADGVVVLRIPIPTTSVIPIT